MKDNLTEWKFWCISAPVTLLFVLGTLYLVLFKKYESGEYHPDRPIVRILRKCCILGVKTPEGDSERG
jgi:hypothetical protein